MTSLLQSGVNPNSGHRVRDMVMYIMYIHVCVHPYTCMPVCSSLVPRLSHCVHAIIDDLCTRKDKLWESLIHNTIVLREGVERPEISVGRVTEYCPRITHKCPRARSKGGATPLSC